MTLSPGSSLGPYRITAELGHGGMGVVYTAQDPRLKRQVAIKLLPPDLTRDETAKQRFLQEAQAASALDHPNICTIFEINETEDGQLYLVMAHYEGETLKERIERGALPVDDSVDIATQVGRGLAEAHGAGIVHRDIKPANLLIATGGTVKILDFGLAKLAGAEGVTQTGSVVGTVAYMSPEQARGEEVDHRTDIWSLGVVLHEMLSGQPPFRGDNLLTLSHAIQQEPPPVLAGDSSSPSSVVVRSLDKSQSQRYQAVTDLLAELQGARAPGTQATSQPDVPSIAVLPFDDMSPERDQAYFCEGMAEEVINALTSLEGLHVASRTSAFLAKAKNFDIAEIGDRLKVEAVLEGSVRKAGNRLRVTAQWINVSDGYHVWSERYDRDMDDVFTVQDDIARTVVEKLKVKLLGEQDAPMVTRPTDNLDAFTLVLRGRYHFERFSKAAFEKSLEYFTKAVELEPGYARAHAGVAQVLALRSNLSFAAPRDDMPRAKEAALKGLAIDETVADAHFALALVLDYYEWDRPAAEREYRRALELNPADTQARTFHAELLGRDGRADAAVAEARYAVERDPLSVIAQQVLALEMCSARRFDAAITEARNSIEFAPTYHPVYWDLGWSLAGLGRYEEAVEAFTQATILAPGDPLSQGYLGWALGLAGRKQEAHAVLEDLERRRTHEYFSGFVMAHVSLGLGDQEQAISWLQVAAAERDGLLSFCNVWFAFDPIRADPRFQALLRRMNFPETATTA
jgi:serine/threonine protein kinase/Tfp pilus assembly protein PilF